MRVLFDTHYVLWIANDISELTKSELAFVSQDDMSIIVSSVSLWELRLKWRKFQRDGTVAVDASVKSVYQFWSSMGVKFVELTIEHAITPLVERLPHKDPFDELLVVQAQKLGARILTRDDKILTHPLSISA